MGDFAGHPFRGNQYTDAAGAEAGARTHIESELRAATGYQDTFRRGGEAMRRLKNEAEDAEAMGRSAVAKGIKAVLNDPKYAAAYTVMVQTQRGAGDRPARVQPEGRGQPDLRRHERLTWRLQERVDSPGALARDRPWLGEGPSQSRNEGLARPHSPRREAADGLRRRP